MNKRDRERFEDLEHRMRMLEIAVDRALRRTSVYVPETSYSIGLTEAIRMLMTHLHLEFAYTPVRVYLKSTLKKGGKPK